MASAPPDDKGPRQQDGLGLTNQIKTLSLLSEASDLESTPLKALLVCREKTSIKWGLRWLRQVGLSVEVQSEPRFALQQARDETPDVIVVEAGLQGSEGTTLPQVFADAADISAPLIAICMSSREYTSAIEANAYDVIRKPLDWQLAGKRALQAARANATSRELAHARKSLTDSLVVAEHARQLLRSRESYEPVTGLPNKSKFVDLLKHGMLSADRDRTTLAVFVTGFSRFRLVVEALGQNGANFVLAEVGKRLGDCLRDTAVIQKDMPGLRTAAVGAIDNSRFGLMMTCSAEAGELGALRKKLEQSFSKPVEVHGQTIYLSACIGASLYPRDAAEVDQLLQRADNAMRDARSRGGGFKFYCAETDAAAARKLQIEHQLHEALDRDELTVAYQPIVETQSGRITGAEALLRWQQPDQTYIPPDEFVPVAEESGLMIPIGAFILNRACRRLRLWQSNGLPLTHICVNVSKCQLMSGDFVATVREVLERHEIAPESLELELSERGVFSGDYDVISQLQELKQLGVLLSIDDFGAGDAAMGYLKELPIDVVKIDRSYINGLIDNHKDAAITSAMIVMAQKLDLKVIAEGVESSAQLAMLRNMGCDQYQGFLVSPAVPSAEFQTLFAKAQSSNA